MTRAVITGCATGIGAATRARLEALGHEVIGVDVKDVEVIADLSRPDGRAHAVDAVLERTGGRVDRLLLCAGIGGHVHDAALVVSVNYFGCVALLDGLFEALQGGTEPAAVAVCSNSAQLAPTINDLPLVAALLDGEESRALEMAAAESGQLAYIASKNAVGRAVRRRAMEWGQAGVRLNAIAPGVTQTPLVEAALATPGDGDAIRSFPVPLGRRADPDDIARVIEFLLEPEAAFVHGAVWYADGGSDAMTRPDRF